MSVNKKQITWQMKCYFPHDVLIMFLFLILIYNFVFFSFIDRPGSREMYVFGEYREDQVGFASCYF